MFRLRNWALAGCILAIGAFFVRAQDTDLKAVLRKAIEAHGGEKNLAKFKAAVSKFKGSIEIQGNKYDITGETSLQKPDKVKNVMTLNINGKMVEVVTVFNGKKLWVASMGQTKEIDDEKILKAAREEMQAEGAGSLADFLEKPYELNALGDVKVKGKDAIGIRVSKKGQKDISVFFDKKTHLVVKTEMRTLDGMTGQEVTQEKFVVGYQEKSGMKIAKRVEIVKDGKTFMDIEILDTQPFEKLDDSIFAKP
jgi:outer membrane lipoprotein-sorting protein